MSSYHGYVHDIFIHCTGSIPRIEKTKPYVRIHAAILGGLIQVEDKEVWNKTASKESQFIINSTFKRNWNMSHFYQRGIILIFPLWVLFIYLARFISFYVYTLPSFILFAIRQQQKMFRFWVRIILLLIFVSALKHQSMCFSLILPEEKIYNFTTS